MPSGDTGGADVAERRPYLKKKKKKVALARREWQINPVTRVKPSAKTYSRSRVKSETGDDSEQ
jgi:hypothetical protein